MVNIDFEWMQDRIFKRDLSTDERECLKIYMGATRYQAGKNIITQGKLGGTLYILRSGHAEVFHNIGKDRVQVASLKEGGVVGEMTFLTQEPASADVVATEDCVAYTIHHDACIDLMRLQPDLVFAFVAYMLTYIAGMIRKMNERHSSMFQYIIGQRS